MISGATNGKESAERRFNPYVLAPNDAQLAAVRRSSPIGTRSITAFSARSITGNRADFRRAQLGASRLLYKFLFAAADLCAIAISLAIDRRSRAPRRRCLAYARNRFVVYSFAGAAHFDSLMILPMLAGIYFVCAKATLPQGRPTVGAMRSLVRSRWGLRFPSELELRYSLAGLLRSAVARYHPCHPA